MIDVDTKGLYFAIKFAAACLSAFLFVGVSANLISGLFYTSDIKIVEAQNLASATNPVKIAGGDRLRLAFVGDIMLDRGVKESILKNGGGDYRYIFENIYQNLRNYDVLFGNLEGPISDKGQDQESFYSFRMRPETANALAWAGFDMVSAANNHIWDWGAEATMETLRHFSEASIKYAGIGLTRIDAYSANNIIVNGVKIAFLAFTDISGAFKETGSLDKPTVALTFEKEIESGVKAARRKADVIIVYFHFGDEYKQEPNENQKKLAHLAIDSGADLVIGTHPHVVQSIEQYKNGYIAYSLGNFIFDQDFSEDTMRGLLLEVELENGQIIKIMPKTVIINGNFQPTQLR